MNFSGPSSDNFINGNAHFNYIFAIFLLPQKQYLDEEKERFLLRLRTVRFHCVITILLFMLAQAVVAVPESLRSIHFLLYVM